MEALRKGRGSGGRRSLSALANGTTCGEVGKGYVVKKEAMLATFEYFASIVAHED